MSGIFWFFNSIILKSSFIFEKNPLNFVLLNLVELKPLIKFLNEKLYYKPIWAIQHKHMKNPEKVKTFLFSCLKNLNIFK